MNRSNMKTLLLAGCAVCLTGLLCQSAAGEKTRPPATTRPTTRPAKVNITIGKDTTYITGPLNADGTVNYVAYLNARYGKGVTLQNNAMVLLVRALGPEPWQNDHLAKALKMMGIAMPPPGGNYFVTIKASDQRDRAVEAPWSAKKLPIVASWLKANAKPLALVVAATKRSRLYHPLVSKSDPPNVADSLGRPQVLFLEAARALSARAMLRLESGDRAGAWADIMAVRRLGRLLSQGPTLIDLLVGLAADAMGCECSGVYITHGKLPPERLRACLADMRAMAPLPDVHEAVANERFMALDAVMLFARGQDATGVMGPGKGIGHMLADAMTKRILDWNEMLRTFNHWHDRLGKALAEKDVRKRRKACEELNSDLEKLGVKAKSRTSGFGMAKFIAKAAVGLGDESITKAVTELLVSILMPALGRIVDIHDKTLMRGELVHVATALAFHEAQKGRFPTKLADLTPKYLKTVPTDRFSGKAMIYKRQDKGCIVYSVGMNLKDDGGIDNSEDEDAEDEKDDIVVRFKR